MARDRSDRDESGVRPPAGWESGTNWSWRKKKKQRATEPRDEPEPFPTRELASPPPSRAPDLVWDWRKQPGEEFRFVHRAPAPTTKPSRPLSTLALKLLTAELFPRRAPAKAPARQSTKAPTRQRETPRTREPEKAPEEAPSPPPAAPPRFGDVGLELARRMFEASNCGHWSEAERMLHALEQTLGGREAWRALERAVRLRMEEEAGRTERG